MLRLQKIYNSLKTKLIADIYSKYGKYKSKNHINNIKENKEIINQISDSFCSAKWLQVSLLLQNGTNHSCHHPPQHKVNLEDVKKDPSKLHNTEKKKEDRKLMLKGERPKGCDYCWNIEDQGKSFLSDRILKSVDKHWSLGFIDEILDKEIREDIIPTYVEVAFENTCNLKCAYCSPDISSSWYNEIKQYGPYPTRFKQGSLEWLEESQRTPIKNAATNEYIDAFWQWWPQLYPKLKVFRITGGEPLLSSSTWRALSYIEENPKKDLILSINTNLCVKEDLLSKLIRHTESVSTKIKQIEIHTSCEATSGCAEYIRFGLSYNLFISNLEQVLRETNDNVKINIMITFNVLSMTSFISFLDEIKRLRMKYMKQDGFNKLVFMISYLRWPKHLSINIADKIHKEEFIRDLKKYTENNSYVKSGGFLEETEIDQINRLCEYIQENLAPYNINEDRIDFRKFIREYDIRKKLDFHKVFPELGYLLVEEEE